ncbi:MAG: glycosyltransferase family 4 protein [Elusimicrobiota bacterium]
MRIGLLHGWLLDGSGSNIYVRELARALRELGHEVHVLCQEPHPERFPQSGRIHVPAIDRRLMPVYVADTEYEGFAEVRAFSQLVGDPRLETYLADFAAGAARVCRQENIEVLHANHVYPMPEIARRVKEQTGVPFLVFPHGSAIEYALKQSPELAACAARSIDAADALVVGNHTVSERIFRLFPDHAAAWRKKHSIVPVGVDAALFAPVARAERDRIGERLAAGGMEPGGRTREMTRSLLARRFATDQMLVQAADMARSEYAHKAPDGDLLDKLSPVDWAGEKVLLYAGKLIVGKGVHDLLAALPEVLERHPRTTLFIVGEGPFREALELLLGALGAGDRELLKRIIRLGGALSRQPGVSLANVAAYAERIGWDRWLDLGRRTKPLEKVVFTGYLKHALYRHLLPCADIAVFPSEVAEAYPLVLLESISAGVLPVAADFEGLGEGLDAIAGHLPPEIGPCLRIAVQPERRIASMVDSLNGLLAREPDWRGPCRELAAAEYSWETAARRMAEVYRRLVP